jgi:NitT/TauT family transport system permease protein
MATEQHTHTGSQELDAELSGLDKLEMVLPPKQSRASRLWAATWPKLLAIAIVLAFWQFLVWIEWKPDYVLPPPSEAFQALWENREVEWQAARTTMWTGIRGYVFSLFLGTIIGALVARNKILRSAFGSMITGLQTMPSVAWVPFAIVLFGLNESAIFFVVVLGAAPSIANGLINGIDNIPPILLRAGRVLGAKRWQSFRYVILPASLPSFIGGMKQGWAFAWRSLLAGELIAVFPGRGESLGQLLEANRAVNDVPGMIAIMIIILAIGVLVDSLVFGKAERWIRRRYGLVDEAIA